MRKRLKYFQIPASWNPYEHGRQNQNEPPDGDERCRSLDLSGGQRQEGPGAGEHWRDPVKKDREDPQFSDPDQEGMARPLLGGEEIMSKRNDFWALFGFWLFYSVWLVVISIIIWMGGQ
jgi:hypothetical protein